jgi:outer membrane protein assembly factor BamB
LQYLIVTIFDIVYPPRVTRLKLSAEITLSESFNEDQTNSQKKLNLKTLELSRKLFRSKIFARICAATLGFLFIVTLAIQSTEKIVKGQDQNVPVFISFFIQNTLEFSHNVWIFWNEISGRRFNLQKTNDFPLSETANFPDPTDDGYILFAGIDSKSKQPHASLLSVADGKQLYEWKVQKSELSLNAIEYFTELLWLKNSSPITHPFLLANGQIIANVDGGIARLDACKAKPVWFTPLATSHSLEMLKDGTMVGTTETKPSGIENVLLSSRIADNAITRISQTGELLTELPFTEILARNNLLPLLFYATAASIEADPIHLNQITEAKSSGEFWQQGDLLISARNLSTIFLYRPSSGKIIWHQTGPWLHQHSAFFLGDHQISILNNNSAAMGMQLGRLSALSFSGVMIYDFKTGSISEPWKKTLNEMDFLTVTEGRARVLDDGSVFIEETNRGRMMRVEPGRVRWVINNNDKNTKNLALTWSRYLTKSEVKDLLPSGSSPAC